MPPLEAPSRSRWGKLGNILAAIFIVAVLCNYPWELAQSPLYVGMTQFRTIAWHCFKASLGDGLLVLIIFVVGWAVLRQYA